MRAILFINKKNKRVQFLANEIKKELGSLNIIAEVFPLLNGKQGVILQETFDVAISLGGDGTVLSAARAVSPMGTPIFPVNFGTFGFIAGVQPPEWRELFKLWLEKKAPVSRRLMLNVTVQRDESEIFQGCCLNDVVISASGIAKIIRLKVSYHETAKNTLKLGSYRSDGLIVSTPTGTTAYSAAAGGPIVDPELEAMILNPICPFPFPIRPLVLPAGETVIVDVEKEQRSEVLLTVDGQETKKMKSGDRIYLKKAAFPCLLIASGRTGFYETLRTKFLWPMDPVSSIDDKAAGKGGSPRA